MAEHEGDIGIFLAGFVIGGMVGSIVALLLAPQSGEETRTIIHDRSIELKDKAVEKAEAARIKAEAAAAEARARADELAKLTQEKALEMKKKGEEVVQSYRSKGDASKSAPAAGEIPEVTVEG
jgi:gas vesicle protein